jgi:hypothetical protein
MQRLHRFQYVDNVLMAGNLERAAHGFGQLPEAGRHRAGSGAREKCGACSRAGTARVVARLHHWDLRGRHYVLTGGVLASQSPYGFNAGMIGRWAYVGDSPTNWAAVRFTDTAGIPVRDFRHSSLRPWSFLRRLPQR